MRKRGRFMYVGLSVAFWLGCYVAVRLVHVACFKFGWVSSPGVTNLSDAFFFAVVPGVLAAELDWSDMKRKFSLPETEDRTMI